MVPINVVVHRHEDDAPFELIRMDVLEHLLHFGEELNRGVSWVNPPLEHDWLPNDVVEVTIFWRRDAMSNSTILPDFSRLWLRLTFFVETQHRIIEQGTRSSRAFRATSSMR